MRFLADENLSRTLMEGLRAAGHDVLSARELMPRAADIALLARAQVENRTVMTYDKDFAQLAFRDGRAADAGIVLLRLTGPTPASDLACVLRALAQVRDLAGAFMVVTNRHVRVRRLPEAPD